MLKSRSFHAVSLMTFLTFNDHDKSEPLNRYVATFIGNYPFLIGLYYNTAYDMPILMHANYDIPSDFKLLDVLTDTTFHEELFCIFIGFFNSVTKRKP